MRFAMSDGRWAKVKVSPFHHFTISLFLFICLSAFSMGPEETAKQVAAALKSGNAAAVSNHFGTMVSLSVPGFDETYSKTQAGQILKDFFSRTPVTAFKVTRQGSSEDGSHYSIGELQSGQKKYRVYYLIRQVSGKPVVQQLQIQEAE
jgi:hypothetical protein